MLFRSLLPFRSARLLPLAALVASTAACEGTGGGGNGPLTEPFGSGTRLKVEVEDGGEGALRVSQILDADRGDAPCFVQEVTAGDFRCIPLGSSVQFADASCQTMIVLEYTSTCGFGFTPEVAWLFTPGASSCDPYAVSIYEVGPATTTPAMVYSLLGDGTCSEGFMPGTETVAHSVGAEIPASSFAAVSIVESPRADGLVALYQTSDDGFFQLVGSRDVARDVSCGPGELDGVDVCVPSTSAWVDFSTFGDAACTEQVASVYGDASCPTPTLVGSYDYDPVTCTGTYGLATVGAEVANPFSNASGPCEPATVDPLVRYFEIGAPVPASELVAVTPTQVGTGRLRVRRYEVGGAPIDAWGSFYDSQRDENCWPQTLEGTLRCVPDRTYADSLYGPFADAACTQPLVYVSPDTCSTYDLVQVDDYGPDGCSIGTALHQMGAPHAGTVYYSDPTMGTCIDGGPQADYATLGPVVPATDFAPVTRHVL